MGPGVGKASALATRGKTTDAPATGGDEGPGLPPSVVVLQLPLCHAIGSPSLESFHPQRSSRPTDNTKLTQREVSHFIATAIAAEEEDGFEEEEERGPEEGIEDTASPRASLYSQRQCAVSGSGPSDQPSAATKDPGEPARRPFNPHSMAPSGCVMTAA
jgi:hypothetical protein